MNTIEKRLSVKNVKSGFGHDLMGLFADIYLDNKKVGHYNDDGWGGEIDLQLKTEAQKIVEDMMVENNVGKLLFEERGWGFLGSLDKVTMSIQIETTIFDLIKGVLEAKERKAFERKLAKDMVKGICVGTNDSYRTISFKDGDLPTMVRLRGAATLTNIINMQIVPKINIATERILNTNLKDLGINLD